MSARNSRETLFSQRDVIGDGDVPRVLVGHRLTGNHLNGGSASKQREIGPKARRANDVEEIVSSEGRQI
jgi:hypothetical protein